MAAVNFLSAESNQRYNIKGKRVSAAVISMMEFLYIENNATISKRYVCEICVNHVKYQPIIWRRHSLTIRQ